MAKAKAKAESTSEKGEWEVTAIHVVGFKFKIRADNRRDAISKILAGKGAHDILKAEIEGLGLEHIVAIEPVMWETNRIGD